MSHPCDSSIPSSSRHFTAIFRLLSKSLFVAAVVVVAVVVGDFEDVLLLFRWLVVEAFWRKFMVVQSGRLKEHEEKVISKDWILEKACLFCKFGGSNFFSLCEWDIRVSRYSFVSYGFPRKNEKHFICCEISKFPADSRYIHFILFQIKWISRAIYNIDISCLYFC